MARIPARIPGRELEELEDKLYLSNSTNQTGELQIHGGAAGEKVLEIFSGSTSILQILATTTTARILGGSNKPVQIGDAGSTSHSLAANDDLFVSGKLEVDGISYFDSGVYFFSFVYLGDNDDLTLGDSPDSRLDWSTAQATENTLIWGLGDTAKSIIFCDYSDRNKDFDHAGQTNPTIFVHSATDPDTDNTQWLSISHNQTDGVIACGKGTLNLGGTTVNFVNATRTVAADAAMNAYVELEIGGAAYKFMLTA